MKRILSSLLMLTMLLSMMPFALPAMASDTSTEVYYYNDFTVAEDLGDMVFSVEGPDPVIENGAVKLTNETRGVSNGFLVFLLKDDFILDFSSEATKPELVVEMRIKTHFGDGNGYFTAWHNPSYNRLQTFGVNKGGLYADRYSTDTYYGNYENEQWQTVTVVYGSDSSDLTRDVYLNGEKLGTFDGNYYAQSGGKVRLAFMPVLPGDGQYIMIDYIKIYEKPTSITAEIIDARDSGVVVGFSSAPANVSTENFLLASETEIESIERINETTYRVIPASALASGDTLTVSGITDTLGLSLAQTDLNIAFNASSYAGYEYLNAHFEGSDELPDGLSTYGDDTVCTISDGVLNLGSASAGKVGFLNVNTITNEEATLPEFVLEFKNKVNSQESGSYIEWYKNKSITPLFVYSANTYHNSNYNSWSWLRAVGTVNGTIDDVTKWHTYAIKYSNKDNTRSLYIDGKCVGQRTGTEADNDLNTWYANGSAWFRIRLYSAKGTMTSDYDYIKAYAPADNFTATIIDNTATELNKLTLDFNGTVMNISPANISVNGKAPASVTCVDEENQKYEVVLSTALQPETPYKVSLNGVTNTIGQTTYDVLSFTTRALEAGEAYYTVSYGGVVKADGVEITDGTYYDADAESTFVVKANKGYKAVVKVNGTEKEENNKYGEYTIDTTNVAEIEVTFEEAVTPSFSTPVSFVDESAPDTSYTFVRLNMATDSFGVIVSSDQNKLNAEDADGVTTFILPATNGSNAFGEYGISIKDRAEGNVLGNTYYVRPYAKLGDKYYYQNPVTVNVTTVQ